LANAGVEACSGEKALVFPTSGQENTDIIFGKPTLTLRLRTVAKPNRRGFLLAHLSLHRPKGSIRVQNVVEKIA
jgi:hypothetical protein